MTSTTLISDDLRRSLRMVVVGIAFGAVFFIITGGTPLTGYARLLGAGDFLYGLLLALPVIGSIVQFLVAYWIERVCRRKTMFMTTALLQRVIWLPIAFVPFLLPPSEGLLRVWVVIALLCISSFSGTAANVPFLSWMGDLVPGQIRGRFFSRRSAVSTVSSCLGGLAAGYYLDLDSSFTGFAVVFTAAALFGVADILCFIWVREPRMTAGETIPFMKLLATPFRDPVFRRYVIFWSVWMFGVNVSSPFFNVYMLEYLHLKYLQISIYSQIVGSTATFFCVRVWGRLSDHYGNKPVMAICCFVCSTLPLLWLLATPGFVYVVVFINLLSGIFWSGIDLTNLNLLLSSSPGKSRSMFVAVYTLITSLIGSVLAFTLGGLFLDLTRVPVQSLGWHLLSAEFSNYHLLFILSSLLRAMAAIVFLPRLRQEAQATPGLVLRELLRTGFKGARRSSL